jgi:hypothetical protein
MAVNKHLMELLYTNPLRTRAKWACESIALLAIIMLFSGRWYNF